MNLDHETTFLTLCPRPRVSQPHLARVELSQASCLTASPGQSGAVPGLVFPSLTWPEWSCPRPRVPSLTWPEWSCPRPRVSPGQSGAVPGLPASPGQSGAVPGLVFPSLTWPEWSCPRPRVSQPHLARVELSQASCLPASPGQSGAVPGLVFPSLTWPELSQASCLTWPEWSCLRPRVSPGQSGAVPGLPASPGQSGAVPGLVSPSHTWPEWSCPRPRVSQSHLARAVSGLVSHLARVELSQASCFPASPGQSGAVPGLVSPSLTWPEWSCPRPRCLPASPGQSGAVPGLVFPSLTWPEWSCPRPPSLTWPEWSCPRPRVSQPHLARVELSQASCLPASPGQSGAVPGLVFPSLTWPELSQASCLTWPEWSCPRPRVSQPQMARVELSQASQSHLARVELSQASCLPASPGQSGAVPGLVSPSLTRPEWSCPRPRVSQSHLARVELSQASCFPVSPGQSGAVPGLVFPSLTWPEWSCPRPRVSQSHLARAVSGLVSHLARVELSQASCFPASNGQSGAVPGLPVSPGQSGAVPGLVSPSLTWPEWSCPRPRVSQPHLARVELSQASCLPASPGQSGAVPGLVFDGLYQLRQVIDQLVTGDGL